MTARVLHDADGNALFSFSAPLPAPILAALNRPRDAAAAPATWVLDFFFFFFFVAPFDFFFFFFFFE
jgi:hypothetical protein